LVRAKKLYFDELPRRGLVGEYIKFRVFANVYILRAGPP